MSRYTIDLELLQLWLLGGGAAVVVLFGVWLLLREFNCWYWKVNRRLAVLEEIRDLLAAAESRARAEKEELAAAARRPKETLCRECGARFPGELSGQFCEQCGARL